MIGEAMSEYCHLRWYILLVKRTPNDWNKRMVSSANRLVVGIDGRISLLKSGRQLKVLLDWS